MLDIFSSIVPWIPFSWPSKIPKEALASFGIVAGAIALIKLHASMIRNRLALSLDEKRRQAISFRNKIAFFSIIFFLFVWAGEIREVLLSVAAVLAATFVVSKEVISSFLAGMIFAATRPAKIGDVIEVGGFCGELVDYTWLNMTLLDASTSGVHSGKLIRVPNSLLLSSAVYNHSISGPWRFCQITLYCRLEASSSAASIALEIARDVAAPWLTQARAYRQILVDEHLLRAPDVEPGVSIRPKDKDSSELLVRFVCPADQRHASEQALIAAYCDRIGSLSPANPAAPSLT